MLTIQNSIFTDSQCQFINENFYKIPLSQIKEKLPYEHLTADAFRWQLVKNGMKKTRNQKLSWKIKHNRNFWDAPNLINSFLAGRIAGDGCILLTKYNTYKFSYGVAIKDECIINEFIQHLETNSKKYYFSQKSPHSDNISKMVAISIHAFDNNANNLQKYFNLGPKKTKRLGPTNLQDNVLNLAYLIGLIDADGSIEFQRKGKYGCYPYIGVASCSRAIIDWIKKLVDVNFKILKKEAMVNYHKQDHYYKFYIGGLRACMIIDYLRKFPLPKLARKWENPDILKYIEDKKQEQPTLFLNQPNFENYYLEPAKLAA